MEDLWLSLIEHPEQWVDKRYTTATSQNKDGSPTASTDERPDFVHTSTGMELQINDVSTPKWAKKKLKALDREAAAYWARVRLLPPGYRQQNTLWLCCLKGTSKLYLSKVATHSVPHQACQHRLYTHVGKHPSPLLPHPLALPFLLPLLNSSDLSSIH